MRKMGQWLKSVLFSPGSQFVFILLAVSLATVALLVSLRNERRVKIETSSNVQPTEAEAILARANDATQFADSIMGFLQGASALIGIVLFVGGWMFRNSIQVQIETLQSNVQAAVAESEKFVQQAQQDLEQRQKELSELEQKLQMRMDALVQNTNQSLSVTEKQAQNSFRVLSLQLLAEQQVRAHNITTAIDALKTAYDLDPKDHATNYLLGYLYTSRQEIDKAIEHLEQALTSDPEFTPGIAALGLALRRKGDKIKEMERITERNELWSQAETKLLQALRRDPSLTDADGESYYGSLGGLYRRQKRYDDAIDAYDRAVKITPNSSYPLVNLASIHTHQGHKPDAQHYFKKVVEQAMLTLDDDPRNAWKRCDLAQAKLVLEEKDEALKQLRIVIEQEPERSVLETVYSGLLFLSEAPEAIPGLDEMIHRIDQALKARTPAEQKPTPEQG